MRKNESAVKVDYNELVKVVERLGEMTRFDVACYLIGYKGSVDDSDQENISKLFMNGFIKA